MATKDQGRACPLCLRADEPESMVEIYLPHHPIEAERIKLLCRQCAAMIAVTWTKLEDEEGANARNDDPVDLSGGAELVSAGADSLSSVALVLPPQGGDGGDGTDSDGSREPTSDPGSTSSKE